MTVLGETRAALVGAALVVADAARLLVRHFPALLTVFLLGLAVRNGVLWGTVALGRHHPVIASLLLPLAPLAMMIAFVLMLRIAGSALVAESMTGSASSRITLLISALIPFLTVYTVTGELRRDQFQFVNESFADERYRGTAFSDAGLSARSIVDFPRLQLALLVAFLVLRLAIDLLDLQERHVAWGVVQVLAEVSWLILFAKALTTRLGELRGWIGDLTVVTWLDDGWRTFTGWLGPLTAPVRTVVDLFSGTLDHFGPIVLTPLLWLAVGAVVLVGALPAGRRPVASALRPRVTTHVTSRLDRVRSRRGGNKALQLLGSRFADLTDGLRVLRHGGLLPVLTFCLVLPLARLAEWGVGLALRAVIGPRDPETMILFSRYPDILLSAVNTLLVVVIVVAAVDRLLLRRTEVDEEPAPVSAG